MTAKVATPMPEGVTRENRPKPPPAPPRKTEWNNGVVEGLKVALVFVKKELEKSPDSKKLFRIAQNIIECIDKEKT